MRYLYILAVLALVGCDGGDEPPQLGPEDYTVVKISGDAQTDTVLLTAASTSRILASTTTDPALLPDPLVVKVVPTSSSSSSRSPVGPMGPSFSTSTSSSSLPTVSFVVTEPGCGRSYVASQQPDEDSLVATFWEKGTKAGECWMYARTVVRDSLGNPQPLVQDSFVATFLPGPIAYYGGGGLYALPDSAFPGDTLSFDPSIESYWFEDANGNRITTAQLREMFGWAFYAGDDRWPSSRELTGPTSHDRFFVVPECHPDATDPAMCGSVGIMAWFGDARGGGVSLKIMRP